MSCALMLRALAAAVCVCAWPATGDFLRGGQRSRVMEMTEATSEVIFNDNMLRRRPILVFFRPNSGPRLAEENEVRAALDKLDKRFLVVFSGDMTATELKMMNTMGLFQGEQLPLLTALSFEFHADNPHADFHTFRFRGAITKQAVLDFSQNYLDGKLRPEGVLSEPPPEGEGEHDGGVRHLVGLNFDQVTKNPEKDTLVYWYGDGCGFCQQFKKEYKQLAARLRHVKSLEITWVDASRNGVAQPKRFPTVALFPAHGKGVPASKQVPFLNDVHLPAAEFMGSILKGEETIGAMMSWLHQEATIPFEDKPPAPAEDEESVSMLNIRPTRETAMSVYL